MLMQQALVAVLAALLFGCGGSSMNHGSPAGETVTGDPGTAGAGETRPAGSAVEIDPSGSWENASCGDRTHLRRINFLDGGRFTAIDEVAPCPPKVQCVWSGIIRWSGDWRLDGRRITIEIKPGKDERAPESLPEEYIVLGEDPLSIGERIGELVCPYRRL